MFLGKSQTYKYTKKKRERLVTTHVYVLSGKRGRHILRQLPRKVPFSYQSIFFVLTDGLVNISKKKTPCILKNLGWKKTIIISNQLRIKENKIIWKAIWCTLESKGRASRAVLRRIMLDIKIWLFLELSMLNTSFVTFFGLKQKWQRTLSRIRSMEKLSFSETILMCQLWLLISFIFFSRQLTGFFWKLPESLGQAKKQLLVAHQFILE